MPKITLTIDQLREALEDLSPAEFRLLDRTLDQRRRNRLKEIVEKARQKAAGVSSEVTDRVVREAISEVRAENVTYGRP